MGYKKKYNGKIRHGDYKYFRSFRERSGSSTRLTERGRRFVEAQRSRWSPSQHRCKSRTVTERSSHTRRPHKMKLESSRYEKWDRDRGGGGGGSGSGGGGGGGGGGASGGSASTAAWSSRDRERDRERERERQARAHQMSHAHAAEPDASSLFPAPIRVTGHRDKVSQQIQTKLGDYHLAQTFIDDPSKSIGICAEPASPAPCLRESRRESEFKKPAHAPQNGRVHHRPYGYNKSDGASSTGAVHRPPPLRIPNGFQTQSAIDSSQPPIESILKEMKSLPTPLSVIAATPRKELENKFIFNPYTNKVQENPQLSSNDLKSPNLPKPGLDNRISNSRSSVSPDVVNKDLGLSESDDDVTVTRTDHRLGPPLSPIGSGSPSSGSSSQSDSESESSSAESTAPPPSVSAAPAPLTASAPAQRSSWSLVNFAPPPAQPQDQNYEAGKELRHVLADVKGKPSPISELSDSSASSPSPGSVRRRAAHRTSTSDDDQNDTSSPRVPVAPAPAQKRGRPPTKARTSEERPAKKKRGRPPKTRPPSPPPAPPPPPPDDPPPPLTLQDTKTHIFRKVFTPKKSDEGGGKGGKGGKGKGGKGKGQVTIIEVTAPESGDDDRRHRDRSTERRNEEVLARLSPPQDRRDFDRTELRRSDDRHERPVERIPTERTSNDRIQTERTSNDRIARHDKSDRSDKMSHDRLSAEKSHDRLSVEKIPHDRLSGDKSHDRLSVPDRLSTDKFPDRLSADKHDRHDSKTLRLPDTKIIDRHDTKIAIDRLTDSKMSIERVPEKIDRLTDSKSLIDRLPDSKMSIDKNTIDRLTESKLSIDRLPDNKMPIDRLTDSKMAIDRLADSKMAIDRLADSKMAIDRLADSKMAIDRLADSKTSIDRLAESKMSIDRLPIGDRYVRAEADVGSGLKPGRGSERLEEATSIASSRRRSHVMVRIPLSRLRPDTVRSLRRPPPTPQPTPVLTSELATNHERSTHCSGQTPIYYSYFERLPADTLSTEERDHKYYLEEATRLRAAAEREQEPLTRVMLYLESVLCFVLTGRVLELELDTKGAFTIYRETIEYIKLIHSMPQRFRASPHDTFNKLDILSLRVQALLYLRMFKMYNREVKEYNKIVHEYQQKPACAESVSPLSPTPSPAGSVGSVGSGASASSGYCSLVHSVPAHAHQALLLLTKYYAFLYVAHDLWEQADGLCRLRANQDLFIAVDRKCGPLSLSSTFRHLVQYVRYAITLLKNAPRE